MTEETKMDINENSQPGNDTDLLEPVPSTSNSVKPMDVDNKPVESHKMSKKARQKARKRAQQMALAGKPTDEQDSNAQPDSNDKNSNSNNITNNDNDNDGNSNIESRNDKNNRKKKNKNKQPKSKAVDCPDKILELVLAQSDFKVPNLSAKLDEIIETNNLMEQRGQIFMNHRTYFEDTIPNISEQTIVMPFGFENVQVEVDPSAVTQLQCMYQKPNHARNKGGFKRKKKGR